MRVLDRLAMLAALLACGSAGAQGTPPLQGPNAVGPALSGPPVNMPPARPQFPPAPAASPANPAAPLDAPAPAPGVQRQPAVPATPGALETVRQSLQPLSPEEIKQLQSDLDEAKRASRAVVNTVPRTAALPIDLSPGAAPALLRVAAFMGSAVSFFDVNGAPWPIATVRNHNGRDFTVEIAGERSHTFFVENKGVYGLGALSVLLDGLSTPIPVSILGGQRDTDVKVDFRLPRRKPNATPDPVPASAEGGARHDQTLLAVLAGVPPDGAVELRTNDAQVRAWRLGSALLLRTNRTIMSAFEDKLVGADGTVAVRMALTPVVTIGDDGRLRLVQIDL